MTQKYAQRPIGEFVLHPRNPRQGDIGAIAESIEANGWYGAIVTQKSTDYVIVGNHRLRAARQLGFEELPTFELDVDDATALRIMLADNRSSDRASNDEGILAQLLQEIAAEQGDLAGTLYDGDDLDALLADIAAPGGEEARPSLADRFVVPPFSVLDQRAGYWQERRRRWLSTGIKSELGRAASPGGGTGTWLHSDGSTENDYFGKRNRGLLIENASGADPDYYSKKREAERVAGRDLSPDEFERDHYTPLEGGGIGGSGTSVFDPVLCEVAYRWFSPPDARVLDPFAGGSVRGIAAALLGRRYTGIDLSAEQVAANEAQAAAIIRAGDGSAAWLIGDALDVIPELDGEFDLLFTCPPYYDLEVYSEDPRDLSTMPTEAFDEAYARILAAATGRLADDSFAVLVVSDVRDAAGAYRPLADRTTEIMAGLGLALHNRAVLVNVLGSLPVRAARIFSATHKLGRTHQDVLVYLKGDAARAADRIGPVDVTVEAEPWSETPA